MLETAGLIASGRAAQSRPRRLRIEALAETGAWFEQLRRLWTESFDRLDDLLKEEER